MQSVHHLQMGNGKHAPHMPLQVAQLQSDATNEKLLRNKISCMSEEWHACKGQ